MKAPYTLIALLLFGCATPQPPPMPKYTTYQGRGCAIVCQREHNQCIKIAYGIRARGILKGCHQKLRECYQLCLEEEKQVSQNHGIDEGFRQGERLSEDQVSGARVYPNCDLEIRELLAAGDHVALCINITEPDNTCPLDQERIENWQKAMTDEIGNFYENVVFSYYKKFENFTLVDRNNLLNVLEEHQLSQSGLTKKGTRIEVGKLVGINYLVNIGYNRYCLLPRLNDITTIKLIEIETGKIMAVDTIENWQIYNPKSLQYEIIRTVLNGQEVVMGPDGRTLYRK